MINTIHMEKTTKYQEQLKELFQEFANEQLYDDWADTFELESTDGKKVVISYHGHEKIKKFKKKCKKTLLLCIYSLMGEKRKIKICKASKRNRLNSHTRNSIRAVKFFAVGMIFVCMAAAIVVVLCNYIGNRNFRETFYNVSSIKVDSNVRVIQLSDLHGSSYGQNNQKLLERVKDLEPDIIICTGDMVNSAKTDVAYAVNLAKELSKIAPSYYVYGNNEVETIFDIPLNEKELDNKFGFNQSNRDETALLQLDDAFEKQLESVGMQVLKNEKDTIKVDSMSVDVYGVLTSNPSSFWSYSEKSFANYLGENTDNLKITAVHEPFIFQEFNPEYWGDLMVCGHTHGGLVRVPVLGPLFTHEGGLFPERDGDFVYGRYNVAGSPLIISAGLENTSIFRINNEPELVVVDIHKF